MQILHQTFQNPDIAHLCYSNCISPWWVKRYTSSKDGSVWYFVSAKIYHLKSSSLTKLFFFKRVVWTLIWILLFKNLCQIETWSNDQERNIPFTIQFLFRSFASFWIWLYSFSEAEATDLSNFNSFSASPNSNLANSKAAARCFSSWEHLEASDRTHTICSVQIIV